MVTYKYKYILYLLPVNRGQGGKKEYEAFKYRNIHRHLFIYS